METMLYTIMSAFAILVPLQQLLGRKKFNLLIEATVNHPYYPKSFIMLNIVLLLLLVSLAFGMLLFNELLHVKGYALPSAVGIGSIMPLASFNLLYRSIDLTKAFKTKPKSKKKSKKKK